MSVLKYSEDDVVQVRKYFGKDPESIKSDVEILETWVNQQRHLPNDVGRDFLERVLLRNKFRVEKAKSKLDGYYTLRGVHRQMFQQSNTDIAPSKQVSISIPLPKLTPSLERILIWKPGNTDPECYSFVESMRYFHLVMEILMRKDYSIGDIMIFDLEGVTVEHFKKMSIADMSATYDLYTNAFSARMVQFHLINAPAYVNLLTSGLKLILPKKLYDRLRVCKDLELLHQSVPKECLPKDYGGDLESMEVLKRKWDEEFDSHRKFFDDNYFNVSNEKLRVGDVPQNEIFGTEGTFKKLNLD